MRIQDITEGYHVGQEFFAFRPASRAIVTVTIAAMNYMGQQFKVVYAGNPAGSGNGGIWAANADDLYSTEEEAKKQKFKDKLSGKG